MENNSTRDEHSQRPQIAATIASSIITAMGRPVSMEEATRIYYDVMNTMFPQIGSGRHEMWKKSHDPKKRYE